MQKLAIIGASYLQEPLVRKAQEMGLCTICFAWEEGATCKDLCDRFYGVSVVEKEKILHICEEEKIDGIVTIASDVATVTVNYVASRMGLRANPDEFSQICTNKYKMRQCFQDNHIPSPKFLLTDDSGSSDLCEFDYPLIVKPTDRSGSRGVEKINAPEQLSGAISRACKESFEHKAIIEEFVTGCEISVESISYDGHHTILQITDKVTTEAPYFVELAHHQPSALPDDVLQQVKEIVSSALGALNIRYGASHSELKITEDGEIKVIEVGARMGGDFIGSNLVQLSTGYDFVRAVIDIAMGRAPEPFLPQNKYAGVYFLCKETEWLLPVIENHKENPRIVEARITDPVLRHVECSADRSGYLIYQGEERLDLQ